METTIHEIRLTGYSAFAADKTCLVLGTWKSYGVEQLHIHAGEEWDGLVITATFVTPTQSVRVVIPESGQIDVPQEATAQPLTNENPGHIVFAGTASGVQKISCDLIYLVYNHAPIDGTPSTPTPSEWEQYVTELKKTLDTAVPPEGTPGQILTKTESGNVWANPSGGGSGYAIGDGLKLDPENNILSVDTADAVEQDNTKPVTSAAVATQIGNIAVLLETI